MQALYVSPMPTEQARGFRNGELDANQHRPERMLHGFGPCRHCLERIDDEEMLILSYRPFDELQPYAESGPIFLHAKDCVAYNRNKSLPNMLDHWGEVMMITKGYNKDDRIRYEATAVVPANQLEEKCHTLLADKEVAYIHVRLAQTNCYQFRVDRAEQN